MLAENPINLWTKVWTKPRVTTRYALDSKWPSMLTLLILLTASGFIEILSKAVDNNQGDVYGLGGIILTVIFFSTLVGFIQWYIGAGITYFVGKWIGGTGSFRDIKTAYVVSYIPYLIILVLWIVDILVAGPALFEKYGELSLMQGLFIVISSLVQVAIAIWVFIISLIAVSEAHRFSMLKAFLTVIIPFGIIFALIMLLSLFFFVI